MKPCTSLLPSTRLRPRAILGSICLLLAILMCILAPPGFAQEEQGDSERTDGARSGPSPRMLVGVEVSRARSALANGLPSRALFHVQRAGSVATDSPSLHALHGLCMFELERWDEAVQGYGRALTLAEDLDPLLRQRLPIGRWHARLARAFVYSGNGVAGAREIEKAIAQGFPPDSLLSEQALAALLTGDLERAIDLGTKAGSTPTGTLVVAEALLSQGKAEQAVETLKGLETPDALAVLSRAYGSLGRGEEASATRAKAEKMEADALRGRNSLYEGVRAIQSEAPALAYTKLTTAVALIPNNAHAHAWLGALEILRGENEKARISMETALALEDGHPVALAGLSDLAAREKNQTEALRYAEAAVRRNPYSESLRLKLGTLHLTSGEINDALDDLMTARLLAPEDPVVYLALAGIQEALGHPDLAELFQLQAQALQARSATAITPPKTQED